jgi:hypothetical protein
MRGYNVDDAILMCTKEDTVVLVDPVDFGFLRVAHNHCVIGDPVQRLLGRQSVIRVCQESVGDRSLVLTGRPAALLYLALAGHAYSVQTPDDAHPYLARQARAEITRRRRDGGDWEIVARAVEAWGPMIKPWLGVTKLVNGMPQSFAPEYELRIRL